MDYSFRIANWLGFCGDDGHTLSRGATDVQSSSLQGRVPRCGGQVRGPTLWRHLHTSLRHCGPWEWYQQSVEGKLNRRAEPQRGGDALKRLLNCLMLILAATVLGSISVGVACCADQQIALEIPQGGASMLPNDPIEAIYWSPRGESSLAKNEIVEVRDMPFQRAVRTTTYRETSVAWDVVVGVNLSGSIDAGDVCLLSFYVRGSRLQGKSGRAKADAYLEFTRSPHEKLVTMAVSADKEWRRVYIPFRAETFLHENKVRAVFHLGFQPQTVEIGGISLLNFGKNVSLTAMPATRLTYRGRSRTRPGAKIP